MPDPRKKFTGQAEPTPEPKAPEGEGVTRFVWEKMIKRFPGYAYEVLDALSPVKTRDID